jgi:soluble lytic murein transglycosylase-like protein
MDFRACMIFALLLPALGQADIYAYIDADGVTHFSNVPVDDNYERVMAETKDGSGSPLHPSLLRLSVRYDSMIREAASAADVDPELLRAVIVVESGFDVDAVSRAGAQGLMQLMPATARAYGVVDAFDPRQNLRAGARYLRDLLDRYDQDFELVLAAYNAGEQAVAKYGGQIPPFAETMDYVPKVLGLYNRLILMSAKTQSTG